MAEEKFDDFTENGKKYRRVTIEGKQYRLGQLSALTGNWILEQLGSSTSETTHRIIQAHCYEVCSRYEPGGQDGAPIPMQAFAKPDKWLLPDLATDIMTTRDLMKAVIDFNLGPFLKREAARVEAEKNSPAAI